MEIRVIAIACIFAAFTAVGMVATFFSSTVDQLLIDGVIVALLGVIGIRISSFYLESLKIKEDSDLLIEKLQKLEEQLSRDY